MTYSVNGEYPPPLWGSFGALALVALVGACSSGPEKPKPTELEAAVSLLGVRQIWTTRTAEIQTPMSPIAVGGRLVIAGSDGSVAALDPDTGNAIWQGGAGEPVSAGVGSDGRIAALVTRQNQLVVFEAGKGSWRQKLSSPVPSGPPAAAGRVLFPPGAPPAPARATGSGRACLCPRWRPHCLGIRCGKRTSTLDDRQARRSVAVTPTRHTYCGW